MEIRCSACGAEALLVRRPKYDGFKKVGETLTCSACGHEYAREEDVPFQGLRRPKVFSDADRSAKVEVFEAHEADRICRYCAHYLINPFTQWCSLHMKEVEATDSCDQFEFKPPAEGPPPKPKAGKDPF